MVKTKSILRFAVNGGVTLEYVVNNSVDVVTNVIMSAKKKGVMAKLPTDSGVVYVDPNDFLGGFSVVSVIDEPGKVTAPYVDPYEELQEKLDKISSDITNLNTLVVGKSEEELDEYFWRRFYDTVQSYAEKSNASDVQIAAVQQFYNWAVSQAAPVEEEVVEEQNENDQDSVSDIFTTAE